MKAFSSSATFRFWTALSPKHWDTAWILACLLLGAALRFHQADVKSFTGDEFINLLGSRNAADIFTFNPSEAGVLPVSFAMLYLAAQVGSQEFILRFPAIACGLLTLPVVYQLGRRMFGRPVGLLALLLFAFSPFHIAFSQYVRMYSYLVLFAALVFYFLYAAVTRNKISDWLGLALAVSLVLRTHSAARLLWVMQLGCGGMILCGDLGLRLARLFLARRQKKKCLPDEANLQPLWVQWGYFALCQVLIFVLSRWYVEEIWALLMDVVRNWLPGSLIAGHSFLLFPAPLSSSPPTRFTWSVVVKVFFDQFLENSFYNKLPVRDLYLYAGLWLSGVLSLGLRRQWKQALLIGALIFMTILAVNTASKQDMGGRAVFMNRHAAFLLPFYFLLIACGMVGWSRVVNGGGVWLLGKLAPAHWSPFTEHTVCKAIGVGVAIILPVGILANVSFYAMRTWYNVEVQNWRDVIRLLAAAVQPDECVLFEQEFEARALGYYAWPGYIPCPSGDLAQLRTQYAGVWYVWLGSNPNPANTRLIQDTRSNFATVNFDGMWSPNPKVSHWRREVTYAEQFSRLAAMAVAVSPCDASLRVDWARLDLALGSVKAGLEEYNLAIQLRPDYQQAYLELTNAYFQQNQPASAVMLIRQAFQKNPHAVWPYILRGQISASRSLNQAAIDDFLAAIRLNPYEAYSASEAYLRLASLYQRLGRKSELVAIYQMAVRYNPGEIWAHLLLAAALRGNGDLKAATVEYERILKMDRTVAEAYSALAAIYQDLGQPDKIPAVYQQAVRANPQAAWAWMALGDWYRDSGDTQSALANYRQVGVLDVTNPDIGWRIRSARWQLVDHLPNVYAFSSDGQSLVLGAMQTWVKPYPNGSTVLISASPFLTVSRQVRSDQVLFHPFSSTESTSITFTVRSNPYLSLSTNYALPNATVGQSNGVDYRVEISTDDGKTFDLLTRMTVMQTNWLSQTVSLIPYWQKDVTFRLTSDARGDDTFDWLLVTFDLEPYAETWNLVANAWQGSGKCGAAAMPITPLWGFIYQNRWLVSRSTLPVGNFVLPTQIQFHPCTASQNTTLMFPLKNNPFATLKTSFGLADAAVGRSNGVGYTIAISSTTDPTLVTLFDTQVTQNEWHSTFLDITPYQGKEAMLILTSSALGDNQYDWLQVEVDLFPVSMPVLPDLAALSRSPQGLP